MLYFKNHQLKRTFFCVILFFIFSVIFFSLHHNTVEDNAPKLIPVYRTEQKTVEYIPVEKYVSGVVASEMSSDFHMEALKAQAIASRTYAIAKVNSSHKSEIHPLAPLCDSTHCQVYETPSPSNTKIKKAVSMTASQLLYYEGELVENALYHSCSGGQTENSEDVFVSALPYLKSVDSPYEKNMMRNGHGVGMSQHGANEMAKAGYSYKKILSHYYSGTVVN